jgi:hypothetical protein
MKIAGSLAPGLVGLALTTSAAAQTAGPDPAADVVLRWSAPSRCPTGDQVLEDARTLAVHRGAATLRSPIVVDGVIERIAADRWSLTLTIAPAQRRLEASNCAQLGRAAALFMALVMEPSRGDQPPGDPGDPGGTTSEAGPPEPPPLAPSLPVPMPSLASAAERPASAAEKPVGPQPQVRAARRELLVLAAAGVAVDAGTLPRAEALGTLEVGIRYRRLEVTLQGAAGMAQDTTVDSTAGARLRPVNAVLTPCYAPLVRGRLRLGLCLESEVGWFRAEGLGVPQTRVTDAAWLSLGGGISAWWAFGPTFEARLGAGVLMPVVRPNFELTGLGSVFETGLAVRGGGAAVMRF